MLPDPAGVAVPLLREAARLGRESPGGRPIPPGAALILPSALDALLDCWERAHTPVPATVAVPRFALGPGEDDAEVWIPPATDCMAHMPDQPCPHCGCELHHMRTRRCANCGRRAGS